MLARHDHRLCGCAVVVKAKAAKLPATLESIWELQGLAAKEMDRAWQEAMAPSIKGMASRSYTSRAAVQAGLNQLKAQARAFGRSPGVEELTSSLIRQSYALGRLFIRERDAEVRAKFKLPPRPDAGLRSVQKAKLPQAAQLGSEFTFELVDDKAIAGLDTGARLWFRDNAGALYSANAAELAILDRAEGMLKSGASGTAVGAALAGKAEAMYGTGKFAGKGLTYWGGVVENAASRAAITGQLTELVALGWDRYEVVNPMDERTTPVCQMMNGKVLMVEHAATLLKRMNAATSVGEFKEVKPWASGGRQDGPYAAAQVAGGELKLSGSQVLTPTESKALAKEGWALPPYHFRCRTYIDIHYEPGDPVPVSEMPFPFKKPKGGPPAPPAPVKPKPAPKPTPKPTPKPAPKPTAPPVAPPPAAAAPEGFPWPLDQCKVSPVRLGGANPKFVVEAPDGSLWMFKDYSAMGSEYRASVDKLAALVQEAAGVPTPETHVVEFGKNWAGWAQGQRPRRTKGSISRLFTQDEVAAFDVGGGARGAKLETFGAAAVEDVQVDHIVNWVVSNGDAHYENFIVLKNGRISGIDKGQGFKFFGRDRLDWRYVSPQAPTPSTNGMAYAESQLTRYAGGQAGKGFQLQGVYDDAGELTSFGKRLKAIQDIPDAEYAETIRPYVEAMRQQGRGVFRRKSVDDGVALILQRKNSVLADAAKMYDDLEAARRVSLGIPSQSMAAQVAPATFSGSPAEMLLRARNLWDESSAAVLDKVRQHKMGGYWIKTGGSALEDMGLLGLRYRVKGETGSRAFEFQFKGRLRPSASRQVKARLERLLGGAPGGVARASSQASGGSSALAEWYALPKARRLQIVQSRLDTMWGGDGTAGMFRFIKSFNARFDAAQGHSLYGSPMGKYDQVYDDLLKKMTELAAPGNRAAKRRALSEALGYEVTTAEVKAAKQYRDLLRSYKKADGSWNADAVASRVGQASKAEVKITLGKPPKAAAPTPPPAPKPSADGPFTPIVERTTRTHMALDHVGVNQGMPQIENAWGSLEAKRALKAKEYRVISANLDGKGYIVRHPTNPNVELRFITHDHEMVQYKGDFRIVLSTGNPSGKDLADARKLMESIGVSTAEGGTSVTEMKVLWARKQARAAGLDLDSSTKALFSNISEDLPAAEQLRRLETAFDEAATKTGSTFLRWSKLTHGMDDMDYMPVFTEAANGEAGFAQWVRRDITDEGLKKAGVRGAYSEVSGTDHASLVDIMFSNDNAAMISTGKRAQVGVPWEKSMSPVQDMKTGGANYTFTRMNTRVDTDSLAERLASGAFDPARHRVGAAPGIYYARSVMLSSDGLFYPRDLYGRVTSSGFIDRNMGKTMRARTSDDAAVALKNHMRDPDNEFIPKGSVGIAHHGEFWVVGSHADRTAAIAAARRAGVTELGGKPLEHFFVVSSD